MEEIKGLLNHILKETSGNSEMVKKNSLRIDALFARNQFVPLGEFPPQQALALGLPMTSAQNLLPTGNVPRGAPSTTNQAIPMLQQIPFRSNWDPKQMVSTNSLLFKFMSFSHASIHIYSWIDAIIPSKCHEKYLWHI